MLRRTIASLAAALALSLPTSAETWIVDATGGSGADFTQIPPAVDLALPGDTILVLPGSYAGFELAEGLAILGVGAVVVDGEIAVDALPQGQTAVLADLQVRRVRVEGALGTVVLEELEWLSSCGGCTTSAGRLRVVSSADVRMRGCVLTDAPAGDADRCIVVEDSRLEVVQSEVHGAAGEDGACFESDGEDGGRGLDASASRVHAALSSFHGGDGGDLCINYDCYNGYIPGDAGEGISVAHASELILCGRASDVISGGFGGDPADTSFCSWGDDASGVRVASGSSARVSGVSVESAFPAPPIELSGGTLELPDPADPALELVGTPVPGGSVLLNVYGPPGANIRLYLGRTPRVQPAGASAVEILCTRDRAMALGGMPAEGVRGVVLPLPASLPSGFDFYAQAELVVGPQDTRRTNSIPVIVR